MNETEQLRQEVAALREELNALKTALLEGQMELRCASLHVGGKDERYSVALSVSDAGPALHFGDAQAGASGHLAVLMATEDGANLALSGRDGTPRVVLTAREEGGGIAMLDTQANLGAELWGAQEASWMILHHEGQPSILAIGRAEGGTLETYDQNSELNASLPASPIEVFIPPSAHDVSL